MTIENIDPATLRAWLEAERAVLVDVREPAEYEAEHIEGAALVPLGRIRRATLPKHGGRNLVVMCSMGGRGQAACQRLRAEISAHETIYHLDGGILAWKQAGFPVQRPERKERPAAAYARTPLLPGEAACSAGGSRSRRNPEFASRQRSAPCRFLPLRRKGWIRGLCKRSLSFVHDALCLSHRAKQKKQRM